MSPKINVYLPDDLAAEVKSSGIPVSAVCQQALADAVARAETGWSAPSGVSTDWSRVRARIWWRCRQPASMR